MQVKDNQPGLLRRLRYGAEGRRPSGRTESRTKGRNRLEHRRLTVYPAMAWFKGTPWCGLIETVLRIERSTQRRSAKTGLWMKTEETAFHVSTAGDRTPEQWNSAIRDHWRIENASHYVRDGSFAEDASRIRKNPDIAARLRSFAYNILRHNGHANISLARWLAALDLGRVLEMKGLG